MILLTWLLVLGTAQAITRPAPDRQQGTAPTEAAHGAIRGTVRTGAGKAVGNASVHLRAEGGDGAGSEASAATDSSGGFAFNALKAGSYRISAEATGGSRSAAISVALGDGEERSIELVVAGGSATVRKVSRPDASPEGLAFSDAPSFTIAGITDWTAAGGHGSDASLRTTETLTRDTAAMKPDTKTSSGLIAASAGRAALALVAARHREAAEAAERRGDSLTAVKEFEQAAKLDPSEENYFEWGSELLLHRAIWQAVETFERAGKLYPGSPRVLAGLGTALFAGARYEAAAARLCEASDLDATSETPYVFMGKVELVAPNPLPCVEEKLARYVRQRPADAQANYLYAMALLKAHGQQRVDEAITHLAEAVQADPKCGEAYLELGILSAPKNQHEAVDYYKKAIKADPNLGEAHYRLGVALDRVGDHDAAKKELELHAQIERQQAEAIERERKEVKQFMVALPSARTASGTAPEMR